MTTIDANADHDSFDASRPGHLCWIVDDDSTYLPASREMLRRGAASGAKPVAFATDGSGVLDRLASDAEITADPRQAFLTGGPLVAETMFRAFREQTRLARSEGRQRLCLVADMDWLLPLEPSVADIVGFELALDRVVAELDATVVCAYRTATFDVDRIAGALAVHPEHLGSHDPVPFRFVASDHGWRVAGEIDHAVIPEFRAALMTAMGDEPCRIDVRRLDFIDCAGLRQVAQAASQRSQHVILHGAASNLRKLWELTGFSSLAPSVELRTA